MRTQRKIAYAFLAVSFASVFFLFGCKKTQHLEINFWRAAAREVKEDGWVYSFEVQRLKDTSLETPGFVKYRFFGINLRHRYDPSFVTTSVYEGKETNVRVTYIPALLVWGEGSETQKQDMERINKQLLNSEAAVEDILAVNKEDYDFDTLDKEMVFRLIKTGLALSPHEEPSDIKKMEQPTYALLQEKEYINGYKYQIGFINCMGYIDEIMIDVLYNDGESPVGYVQLSDIVDQGKATSEQKKLLDELDKLAHTIRGGEVYNNSEYDYSQVIAGVELKRLSLFLQDIDELDYMKYALNPIILNEETVSK